MPTPPPAPLPEAQSLVLPGLGAAVGPAMELMAVPKKKVSPLIFPSIPWLSFSFAYECTSFGDLFYLI